MAANGMHACRTTRGTQIPASSAGIVRRGPWFLAHQPQPTSWWPALAWRDSANFSTIQWATGITPQPSQEVWIPAYLPSLFFSWVFSLCLLLDANSLLPVNSFYDTLPVQISHGISISSLDPGWYNNDAGFEYFRGLLWCSNKLMYLKALWNLRRFGKLLH